MKPFILLVFVLCGSLWQDGNGDNPMKRKKKLWTNDATCGLPIFKPLGRVVGGQQARPHSWPWHALVLCSKGSQGIMCGGSVISNQWVVTAAHCLPPEQFNIYEQCTVRLGKHYLSLSYPEASEESYNIIEYAIHDRYRPKHVDMGYDIALAKLSRVIRFSTFVRPICLPIRQPELNKNSVCYSGGWGYTVGVKTSSSASDVLKQLKMTIQHDRYCGFTTRSVPAGIICAGKWNRGEDLCYGDSGGALQCYKDNKWYLHGVLSQVDKNCNSVGSFTKVKNYQQWIESHVG